jgi:hypothetical protein
MTIKKPITKERRKNYPVDPDRSRELAQHSLDMSNKIGRTVPRQEILDALIGGLMDKSIYSKISAIIASKK